MGLERRTEEFAASRLIGDNLIVAAGTFGAGLLGFIFQAVFSHRLQPTDYGATFAALSGLMLIWLPATALSLLMAREASRARALGSSGLSAALLLDGNRGLFLFGSALTIIAALVSPGLAAMFKLPASLVIAAAVGIPFGLALPFLLGQLQGEQRFVSLSAMLVAQAALKLVGALALGIFLGSFGVVLGVSCGAALSYLAAFSLVRPGQPIARRVSWLRPALTYLSVVLPSSLAMAVLFSADVLLVKHFFSARSAGEYAAVAALGRAMFYGAAGVAAVLFPKVVFQESRGYHGNSVLWMSFALVGFGGIVGLLLTGFWSRQMLILFAGPQYASAATYVPAYAVGMIMMGLSSILVARYQSRGNTAFLLVLLPISLLEPMAIAWFHASLSQVVQLFDTCAIVLLTGLACVYALEKPHKAKRYGVEISSVPDQFTAIATREA